MNHIHHGISVKHLGMRDYTEVWREMQAFTENRTEQTQDEIWLLEHNPVFTLGLAGKKEHLLTPGSIPVVQCDRGGQVTYHGPGQVVAYIMYDMNRAGIGVRKLVELLQSAVLDLLQQHGVEGHTMQKAPGVYIDNKKIAALGLRVRHGRSFHGLSLNVDMDMEPFSRINPCGYPDMQVTQIKDLGIETSIEQINEQLSSAIKQRLKNSKAAQT
jgi:lipoyl(octanoyl) transferase